MEQITSEKFEEYETVRQSGTTNMFDAAAVQRLSSLSKQEILEIMKNYGKYKKQFASSSIRQVPEILADGSVRFAKGDPLKLMLRTGKQGEITVPYRLLVRLFGEPLIPAQDFGHTDHKIDAEWVVLTPGGTATIYNYKDGIEYLGAAEGTPASEITHWHLGGQNLFSICFLMDFLKKALNEALR